MTDRVLLVASLTALLIALSSFMHFAQAAEYELPRCDDECERRVINRERRETAAPYRTWLRNLRACESTGDYDAVSPGGLYTGAYQFSDATWRSVGGEGRARDAGALEQDWRAVMLRRRSGVGQWPVCG